MGRPVLPVLLCLCFALAVSAGETPPEKVDALIRDLTSPDFQTREKASEALTTTGPEGDAALAAALDAKDPEVRTRVWDLLPRRAGLPPLQVNEGKAVFRALKKDKGDRPGGGWEGGLARGCPIRRRRERGGSAEPVPAGGRHGRPRGVRLLA